MTRTIDAVIYSDGRIILKKPVRLDRSHRAIVTILGPVEDEVNTRVKKTRTPPESPSSEDLKQGKEAPGVEEKKSSSEPPSEELNRGETGGEEAEEGDEEKNEKEDGDEDEDAAHPKQDE